ncbi:MAG: hypothetical protein E7G31_14640 [Bacteroides sp.]|nr:hypothetical protein [Bacteroides sp.]
MKNLQKTNTELEVSPKNGPSNWMCQTTFKLPRLEGDTQVWLGQMIVSIIRLNIENDTFYSPQMQKGFKTELMASIIEELGISTDDLQKVYQSRKEDEGE